MPRGDTGGNTNVTPPHLQDSGGYREGRKERPETLEQKQAFEYYYNLDSNRNLREVARHFGKSPATIFNWNKKFNWQERVEIRDSENARRIEQASNETIVEVKAKYHKIIKAVIGKFVEDFQQGNIKIRSIKDLEKLMRLDLELLGEDSRKTEGYMEELNRAIQAGIEMVNKGVSDESEIGEYLLNEEEEDELDE